MKCIRMEKGNIRRVSNEMAQQLVKADKACYVPKSEWKSEVRDIKLVKETATNG